MTGNLYYYNRRLESLADNINAECRKFKAKYGHRPALAVVREEECDGQNRDAAILPIELVSNGLQSGHFILYNAIRRTPKIIKERIPCL